MAPAVLRSTAERRKLSMKEKNAWLCLSWALLPPVCAHTHTHQYMHPNDVLVAYYERWWDLFSAGRDINSPVEYLRQLTHAFGCWTVTVCTCFCTIFECVYAVHELRCRLCWSFCDFMIRLRIHLFIYWCQTKRLKPKSQRLCFQLVNISQTTEKLFLALNPWISPPETCFLSRRDEKDDADEVRQVQGIAETMLICAHKMSEWGCEFGEYMKECLKVCICVSLCLFWCPD